MKYLELTLVIFAVVCIYRTEAIPKPSDALNYLEKTVNGTVEFVSDYENQLAVDGDKPFRELLDHEKKAISTNVKDALQVVQKKIQEAHVEDELAQKCYGSAESGLFNAEKKILSVLETCFATNNPDWSIFHEKIKVQTETGKQLLNRFTGIREDCTSELVNEELCIAARLPEAAGLAAVYEANVAKLKAEVTLATANGLKNIAVCSGLPFASFKIQVESIIFTANECVKSA